MENQTPSLVDLYCAEAHSVALTAAAYDTWTGAAVTADEWGTVAITRAGEKYPSTIFSQGAAVYGAAAVQRGGELVAIGDENGTIAVYKVWDGTCVFQDAKEGAEGAARAMRACAFAPGKPLVATLSIDGVVRVFDIQRWERVANWQGFSGDSLEFDPYGVKILAIDTFGQPKILDMTTQEQFDLELVPGGVQYARFTPDGTHVVTMGESGITLIRMADARIVNSFTARGSSGMLNIVVAPMGNEVAAITQRSIHRFSLPDLQPVGSDKHGAEEPTQAVFWDWKGVVVGDRKGRLNRAGAKPSLEPIICCTGYGDHRVGVHGPAIAVWNGNRLRRPFGTKNTFVEVKIDRDGRLVAAVPNDGNGVQVFDAKSGRHLFDAGRDTADTPKMEVGGPIVAVALNQGGLRWYDLKNNNVFELDWVRHFSLSGGGTWLGCVTPKGNIRVLDPANGQDAIPAPEPMSEVPVKLLSFVNRRPDMLVLDEDGVMSVYDLAVSVKENRPAQGVDVLDLNVAVDRLWGITGGKFAAVRFQEAEQGTATVIFVDLEAGEVISEVPNLLPYVWVDPENGFILQPARGGAIQEFDMYGAERRVLRVLPEGEWIAFGPNGILDASEGAK